MIVYPQVGEAELLRRLVAPTTSDRDDPWTLRLFANDYTPNSGSMWGAFVEAGWSGYSPIDLTPADWQPVALVGGRAVVQWSDTFVTFEASSGPQTAYGYWITDATNTIALAAERFAAPVVIDVGSPLVFFLTLALRGEYEPPP